MRKPKLEGEIVTDYLKALVCTGLYGNTLAEARHQLVCRGIERAIERGTIPRRCTGVGYERDHGGPRGKL